MSKPKQLPVDAYSRDEFERNLKTLEDSGLEYVQPSTARKKDEDWRADTASLDKEGARALTNLDRLYANAQREAISGNEREGAEAIAEQTLAEIERIRVETEKTLERLGQTDQQISHVGNQVIAEARTAREEIAKAPPTRFVAVVRDVYLRIRGLYERFRKLIGSLFSQDRFGKGRFPEGTQPTA